MTTYIDLNYARLLISFGCSSLGGIVNRSVRFLFFPVIFFFVIAATLYVQAQSISEDGHPVNLPTSKRLSTPSPGRIASTNSFPGTMIISPDGRFAVAWRRCVVVGAQPATIGIRFENCRLASILQLNARTEFSPLRTIQVNRTRTCVSPRGLPL